MWPNKKGFSAAKAIERKVYPVTWYNYSRREFGISKRIVKGEPITKTRCGGCRFYTEKLNHKLKEGALCAHVHEWRRGGRQTVYRVGYLVPERNKPTRRNDKKTKHRSKI